MINLLLSAVLSLNGEWSLCYFPQPDRSAVRTPAAIPADARSIPAVVPGNCELDLIRAGEVPASETGLNARALRPYEGYQWLYSKDFVWTPANDEGGKKELVFEGVDLLADIFLNGEKIGACANMFIEHRFDVTDRLRDGTNRVQVLLRSVMCESREQTIGELGYSMTSGATGEPFRKAGHMGGWDIFPRVYASGLWRGVSLDCAGPVRLDQTVWIVKKLDPKSRTATLAARCRVNAPFRCLDDVDLRFRLLRNGVVVAEGRGPMDSFWPSRELNVKNVDLWWPKGMGESALYDASIAVMDGERVLAECQEKIGIRTIELERDDVYGKDRPGQFLFKVNGEPCYVRGTNWVPTDAYPSRQAARLVETLELVNDLNCNMVRIWGGGVYEPDAIFDYCDAHGIMVWQDFMTGCSVFPQNDDYAAMTRQEVLSVVLKYRNRASLALWSGNNENDLAHEWRLGRHLARDPNDDRNSRRTIAEVVREFDVTRPYLPSSPYLSPDVFAGKAKPSEDHLWGERGAFKTSFYTNSPAWFVSEMGYHGCPNRASLERMMTKENVYPWTKVTGTDPKRDYHWNREWQFKASDPGLFGFGCERNSLMTNQVKLMFDEVPTDFDDFILASQIVQAEAMKTFVELFRSQKFTKKNGLIWWNVRDGWPQISDAVVDYYGGKKRAYYAIRNVQHDQLVMVRDDHKVVAVNDTLKPVCGKVKIVDRESGKTVLETAYEVPSNAAKEIGAVEWSGQGVLDIVYEQGTESHTNGFLYGEPPFDFAQVKEWMK